jgi:hypothetical protein
MHARCLTASAMVVTCAFTLVQAAAILRIAEADPKQGLRPWLVGPAPPLPNRAALFPTALDRNAAARKRDELANLLLERPAMPSQWIPLASTLLTAGDPPDRVARTFLMSIRIGPNEQRAMMQRGIFGLEHWEILPPDSRRHAVADLVTLFIYYFETERDALREALSAKTALARAEIRQALVSVGLSANDLVRIGL